MKCSVCGSTRFIEEDALYYCLICQSQSQGVIQEVADTEFFDDSIMRREIKTEKKKIEKKATKTGELWTTSEAFNLILLRQMKQLLQIEGIDVDSESFKKVLFSVWSTYLRESGLAFVANERNREPKLHAATRYRDRQILINKVNVLPKFRNGSTKLGAYNYMRLGNDRVLRLVQQNERNERLIKEENLKADIESDGIEVDDNSVTEAHDPRGGVDRKKYQLSFSSQTRKVLHKLIESLDLQKSFESTIDFILNKDKKFGNDENDINDNIIENIDEISDELQQINSLIKKEEIDELSEYDKQLLKNLNKSSDAFREHLSLDYLKKTANVMSSYFIEFMTLLKTIAILNITLRMINANVFTFDLIRWVNEYYIPYFNCLNCFPEDWMVWPNDYKTFTRTYSPSPKSINILTLKIARFVKTPAFPDPNMDNLLRRFAADLNLPEDIVIIIQERYNLLGHFYNKLSFTKRSNRDIKCLPHYERYALMAIVIVLKRIFAFDDMTEHVLSEQNHNIDNLFIWDEWEKYTRLRFQLIKSYIPLHGTQISNISDAEVISSHFLRYSDLQHQKETQCQYVAHKDYELRKELQNDLNELFGSVSNNRSSVSFPLPSLYPLTTATEFALSRIDKSEISSQLSIDFTKKRLFPYVCSHEKMFHRKYIPLDIGNANHPNNVDKWSSSFKLLIDLSCVVLHCHRKDLYVIINSMEKTFFSKK